MAELERCAEEVDLVRGDLASAEAARDDALCALGQQTPRPALRLLTRRDDEEAESLLTSAIRTAGAGVDRGTLARWLVASPGAGGCPDTLSCGALRPLLDARWTTREELRAALVDPAMARSLLSYLGLGHFCEGTVDAGSYDAELAADWLLGVSISGQALDPALYGRLAGRVRMQWRIRWDGAVRKGIQCAE